MEAPSVNAVRNYCAFVIDKMKRIVFETGSESKALKSRDPIYTAPD
jgi:hypothetical protein